MSSTKSSPSGGPRAPKRSSLPFLVLGAIVVVAFAIALLASGGDGGDDDGADTATGDTTTGAGSESGAGELLATAGISVAGDDLAPLADGGDDPAVGTPAPTLEGVDPTGQGTSVEYDEPTLLAFLAHWCPHCQAELPQLVALADEGALDGMDAVVVLTGTDETAPNYPPAPWLEREGWSGRVILDDEGGSAAQAFGLTSYPYLVLVDGDGEVIARNAGELGLEGLRELVAQAG
ncbi:MAG TPA: TlpA disulfide reductase family protein [Acidimicrobiales bacterium]